MFAQAGRFKEIRRTTGVSTTDLTGKILQLLQPEEEEKEGPDSFGSTSRMAVNKPPE